MSTFRVTLDEAATRRLYAIANQIGRTVESLIESAAEEAACDYFRHSGDDPARKRG